MSAIRRIAAWGYWTPTMVIALAVVFLLFSQCEHRRNAESEGRYKERITQLRADSVRRANAVRRVDSVYVTDTVRLTRVVQHQTTLRDTLLQHLTDTVLVRQFIATTDSTVLACRVAITTCEHRVAQRDTMIRVLGEQRGADAALFRVRLRAANPRVTPYAEAAVNPFAGNVVTARAGVDLRLVRALSFTAGAQYQTGNAVMPFLGARFEFR